MTDSTLKDYKFKFIYRFVSIIYENVEYGFDFWNFNDEAFVQSALRFNKSSLLHIYVSSTLYCYYSKEFRKNGDCIEEEEVSWWIDLMKVYGIRLTRRGYNVERDDFDAAWKWFEKNEEKFMEFFDVISDEVVHVLFNDKQFLVIFNRLVRNVIKDKDGFYSEYLKWPEGSRKMTAL